MRKTDQRSAEGWTWSPRLVRISCGVRTWNGRSLVEVVHKKESGSDHQKNWTI